ncbi:MAG: hypothetical protein J3R72DRAFT_472968 [Linnemannia gamsii]|nr:MAG: hypothetical protein J3R72DRAFT_472968 [Linnemannia gamsii]
MWRYHSKEKKMVLASIDTNLSLHVRELTEGVSGRDGKGDRLSYSDVRLMWNVGEGELSMEDAILEELVGVSGPNLRLMTQRADGAEKMVWSERSTEAYFQKWGYFDSSDEEEEEEEEPAENGKGKDKEEKEKENEKEKKEKKEKENEENENENEKKVKVTMKEPDESTSDAGMARALMKRVGTIKRAETIKRAVNDMQAEAMPPVSTIRRAITMPRQSTIERTSTMPRIPIQRASTIPQEGSIEQEEGTMKRARPLKRGASNLKLVQ